MSKTAQMSKRLLQARCCNGDSSLSEDLCRGRLGSIRGSNHSWTEASDAVIHGKERHGELRGVKGPAAGRRLRPQISDASFGAHVVEAGGLMPQRKEDEHGDAVHSRWVGKDFTNNGKHQRNQSVNPECLPEVTKAMRAVLQRMGESKHVTNMAADGTTARKARGKYVCSQFGLLGKTAVDHPCRQDEEAWQSWQVGTHGDVSLSDGVDEYAKTPRETRDALTTLEHDVALPPGALTDAPKQLGLDADVLAGQHLRQRPRF